MYRPRTLYLVSLTAIFLPGLLLVFDVVFHRVADEAFWTTVLLILVNWAAMISPQLLVLVLAWIFPSLRQRFAVTALISLTILLVAFEVVIFSAHDPNSAMLFGFYFPLSPFVLLVVAFLPDRSVKSRGSNNRWRGP